MFEYKSNFNTDERLATNFEDDIRSSEEWKELIFSISKLFRNLPEKTEQNMPLIHEQINEICTLMDNYLSWIDGEKTDPEIIAQSPFFAVCRDAFLSIDFPELSTKGIECIYKTIKQFPVLLPDLINANLFQAFATIIPTRNLIPFPNNYYVTNECMQLIAKGCEKSAEFTEIAIQADLLDIIYTAIQEDIVDMLVSMDPGSDEFNILKQHMHIIVCVAREAFLFFTNVFCRNDLIELISPDDVMLQMIQCLQSQNPCAHMFYECILDNLLTLINCCEKSFDSFISLNIFPLLWSKIESNSLVTERSFTLCFKILNAALNINRFQDQVKTLIQCQTIIDIISTRIGASNGEDETCVAPALHLVIYMIMNDFVDLSNIHENLQDLIDLCSAIIENQTFLDKDAAASLYFVLSSKLGAIPFEGSEEIAGNMVDCIDTKNNISMEIAITGLEALTAQFRANEYFSEHAFVFLEMCVDMESYGERAEFLLNTYFKEE